MEHVMYRFCDYRLKETLNIYIDETSGNILGIKQWTGQKSILKKDQ